MTLNLLHLAICLVIFYTSFCRVVKMGRDTRMEIRLCISGLGATAFVYAFVPLVVGFSIAPIACLFEGSVAALQISTSRLWYAGVPEQFRK